MQHAVLVAVGNAEQQLIEEGFDRGLIEAGLARIVQVLFEVLVEVLEYERQLFLRVHDIVQAVAVAAAEGGRNTRTHTRDRVSVRRLGDADFVLLTQKTNGAHKEIACERKNGK